MTAEASTRIALALQLDSGLRVIPLHRVYRVVGYATLEGQAEDYLLGWMSLDGEQVPVFDLNRLVCERPTPECFGSRIFVVETDQRAPVRLIGLLAPGLTRTLSAEDAERQTVEPFDVDHYLPMLYPFVSSLGGE